MVTCIIKTKEATMRKLAEWDWVSAEVRKHIERYGITQYGDYGDPNETLGPMSAKECVEQIRKYVSRFGRGTRGEVEEMRDLLKIAHYAGVAYCRKVAIVDGSANSSGPVYN